MYTFSKSMDASLDSIYEFLAGSGAMIRAQGIFVLFCVVNCIGLCMSYDSLSKIFMYTPTGFVIITLSWLCITFFLSCLYAYRRAKDIHSESIGVILVVGYGIYNAIMISKYMGVLSSLPSFLILYTVLMVAVLFLLGIWISALVGYEDEK
jgi:hypothetical protein